MQGLIQVLLSWIGNGEERVLCPWNLIVLSNPNLTARVKFFLRGIIT